MGIDPNKEIISITGLQNHLEIYWMVTDWCNFSCSYCPKSLHEGTRLKQGLIPTKETILNFCDKLNELKSTGKNIEIILSGGEPTTFKYLPDILERLDKNIFIGILTNGSRPIEWWKKLPRLIDFCIISIHKETNIEKIDKLSKFLLSQNIEVTFNCSIDANDWERSKNAYEFFRNSYGRRARKKVINEIDLKTDLQEGPQNFTSEQWEYIKVPDSIEDYHIDVTNKVVENIKNKCGNPLVKFRYSNGETQFHQRSVARWGIIQNNLNHFKGWKCSAGIETLNINVLGEVWAGVCMIRKICNIENFQLPTEYITCTRANCFCPSDVSITKFKPK